MPVLKDSNPTVHSVIRNEGGRWREGTFALHLTNFCYISIFIGRYDDLKIF
jgi:hypothetical protein